MGFCHSSRAPASSIASNSDRRRLPELQWERLRDKVLLSIVEVPALGRARPFRCAGSWGDWCPRIAHPAVYRGGPHSPAPSYEGKGACPATAAESRGWPRPTVRFSAPYDGAGRRSPLPRPLLLLVQHVVHLPGAFRLRAGEAEELAGAVSGRVMVRTWPRRKGASLPGCADPRPSEGAAWPLAVQWRPLTLPAPPKGERVRGAQVTYPRPGRRPASP
jgi:hypothetical protein